MKGGETNNMKKALISAFVIVIVGAAALRGTSAFFSDTETSEDNTLAAGALDLKIDSQAHYAGMVCTEVEDGVFEWVDEDTNPDNNPRTELLEESCVGTWDLKNLGETDKFFAITDLKPGDEGENTISLHVFDNDAWGRIRVTNLVDNDNGCTEPEVEADDVECVEVGELQNEFGELTENMSFHLWLDEGTTPGFQCYDSETGGRNPQCKDVGEGNNIFDDGEEETAAQVISQVGNDIVLSLAPGLAEAYLDECTTEGVPLAGVSPDGHNSYGLCHGLAEDGRMVGSSTYYIGVAWSLNPNTGNEAQTDGVSADISFEIEQYRNNPTPFLAP